jgi:SNF2 family DNA or RNA helicase
MQSKDPVTVDGYTFRTAPMEHQLKVWERSKDAHAFALLMEQGTGKSKVAIDTAAYLYQNDKIDTLVISAPNGVHTNWAKNEIPKHLPKNIPYKCLVWRPRLRKAEKEILEALQGEGEFLRIFCFNVEALQHGKTVTNKVYQALKSVIEDSNTLYIQDESSDIKTPGKNRTKRTTALGARYTDYRRILSGTSITQTPFDFFTQFRFLDPNIINKPTFADFKAHYGEYERQFTMRGGKRVHYDELIAYRNIDELVQRVKPYSYRVKKEDCLDLPPKVMEPRYVELEANQTRMYAELRAEGLTELRAELGITDTELTPDEELWSYLTDPSVPTVVADHALTVRLRLQQIVGGWVKTDRGLIEPCCTGTPPKLSMLLRDIDYVDEGKFIIWAHFKHECDAIHAALQEKYGERSSVLHTGDVKDDDREIAKERFQEDDTCRFFTGTPQSGGRGLTLTAAATVGYYSNGPSAEKRQQSEDRAHRIGSDGRLLPDGKRGVVYWDYLALDTLDSKILNDLNTFKSIADSIYEQLEGA